MLLIWRGWGLLAVVSLFPLLASCAGLINVESFWIFTLAAAGSLLLAGAVCVHCGTRWNRGGTEHSFYFVPLQVWGWGYLAAFGLFAVVAVAGGVFRVIQPLPGPPDPRRPDPVYLAIAGGLGLIVVVATARALIRPVRARSANRVGGEDAEVNVYEKLDQIAKTLQRSSSSDILVHGKPLSDRVKQLARDPATKSEAIKVYREETGAGLPEAKEIVEAFINSK